MSHFLDQIAAASNKDNNDNEGIYEARLHQKVSQPWTIAKKKKKKIHTYIKQATQDKIKWNS